MVLAIQFSPCKNMQEHVGGEGRISVSESNRYGFMKYINRRGQYQQDVKRNKGALTCLKKNESQDFGYG
jgi:hypothetical protein